jgi:acyl-CoA thioesterase FadM
MENLPYHQGVVAMMRGMDARLTAPARVGQELRVESWLEDRSGREITVKGQLQASDGSLIAQATASLVALDQQQAKLLGID